jgi:hypothetical protein
VRRYGRVETGFWQNRKVRQLSEDGKAFALYLLTCPHGNAAGCFVLPPAYAADDLGWARERVEDAFAAVAGIGFAERDANTDLVRLVDWWGHNQIENPNVAKHIVSALKGLPKSPLRAAALRELAKLEGVSEKVSEALRKGFETVSETLSEPTSEPPTGFRNIKPKPNLSLSRTEAEGSGDGGRYVFEGAVVKLIPADFEQWRKSYHAIPDLPAELTAIDAKFRAKPPEDWFGTASGWLRTKHERLLKEGAAGKLKVVRDF